ncbi:MAG: hypothetical protein JWO13_420 [Acidobacteriales bacterium]|nr:hypothetical protein [Terriglobales bacterium]
MRMPSSFAVDEQHTSAIVLHSPEVTDNWTFKPAHVCVLLAAVILIISCGTPVSVKRLSSAQAQITESYQQNLKDYFEVIERFADSQEKAADALIDLTLLQIKSDLKKNAIEDAAKAGDEAARKKMVSDLTLGIAENVSSSEQKKLRIHELIAKLKSKNAELLTAHAAIVVAQKKLDDYIQMKKADEAVFSELIGVVGVNKEKLAHSVSEITNIAAEIQKISSEVKEIK